MEKFACLVLCFAAFVSAGTALKCYSCDSDKVDGCLKGNKHTDVPCGTVAPGFQSVCLYKHTHDTAKNTDHVKSTCESMAAGPISSDKLNSCTEKVSGIEIKECRVCNTDFCNSSPSMSSSLASFLCLPLMYLVTKFVLS